MTRNPNYALNHNLGCRCVRCYVAALGSWIDDLGSLTSSGGWTWFVTISYKSPELNGSGRPSARFGNRVFDLFLAHLELVLGCRIEFIVCDQYGELNGRFHQHALMSAKGMDTLSHREVEGWLRANAGWSRVLPFRQGAAYYVARYIGRNLESADWKVEVGNEVSHQPERVGKRVIAVSAALPSDLFHQSLPSRKR